jgi:hypothetical protein
MSGAASRDTDSLTRTIARRDTVLTVIRNGRARGVTTADVMRATGLSEPMTMWLLGALVGWGEIAPAPHVRRGQPRRWVALRTSRGSTVDELPVPGGETT